MFPYYDKDIKSGKITKADALELLTFLWIKTLTVQKIRSQSHTLSSAGLQEGDAYNYSAIGCVETAVPSKWGYRCTGMSYVNFPRVLLCTMNNGVDMTIGKRFTSWNC